MPANPQDCFLLQPSCCSCGVTFCPFHSSFSSHHSSLITHHSPPPSHAHPVNFYCGNYGFNTTTNASGTIQLRREPQALALHDFSRNDLPHPITISMRHPRAVNCRIAETSWATHHFTCTLQIGGNDERKQSPHIGQRQSFRQIFASSRKPAHPLGLRPSHPRESPTRNIYDQHA